MGKDVEGVGVCLFRGALLAEEDRNIVRLSGSWLGFTPDTSQTYAYSITTTPTCFI